jgi:transaldolase
MPILYLKGSNNLTNQDLRFASVKQGKGNSMNIPKITSDFNMEVQQFIKKDFHPHFGKLKEHFSTNHRWQKLRQMGTVLWLDTGSIEDSENIWSQEFSALTTNNTLLNNEVQKGLYDSTIIEADHMLNTYELTEEQRLLELAFILNARHALKLVEKFDASVSVEEHTALSNNVQGSVDYARRYYSICPERFIIKIPFTSAGLLATRIVCHEGIPVNHTLGLSARQNYVIARIGKPSYVNVFLGRLNSFITANGLGDGAYFGEKATLASQAVIKKLRKEHISPTRQIGASFRHGKQVWDMAGIDVMTIPPKVAAEALSLSISQGEIVDKTSMNYKPQLKQGTDPERIRMNTLWQVNKKLEHCLDELEKENLGNFTPTDLLNFFYDHGCSDVLHRWDEPEIALSNAEGKIPQLAHWDKALVDRIIGMDTLMNLAGLNSFASDQNAMDERIKNVLAKRAGR